MQALSRATDAPVGMWVSVSCRALRLLCTSLPPESGSRWYCEASSWQEESVPPQRSGLLLLTSKLKPSHYVLSSAWAPATWLVSAEKRLCPSQLQGLDSTARLYHSRMSDIVVGLWLVPYFHDLRGVLWVFFLWEMQVFCRQGCESCVSSDFFFF